MTIDEIFGNINAHMIEGLMVHSQMSDYYNFLGLEGYNKCHEYHFYKESKSFRELNDYYFKHFNKFIVEMPNSNPNVIPADWYKYTRQQVDTATRKNGIANAMTKWVTWEKDTKAMYERMYQELIVMNEISAAMFIKKLIKEVNEEHAVACQKHLELKAMDFNVSDIILEQKELKDKYCKKICKMFK